MFGYGIHYTPRGILYNVSGRYAVELRLYDKKRTIQIGTNDAEKLKETIEKIINTSKCQK